MHKYVGLRRIEPGPSWPMHAILAWRLWPWPLQNVWSTRNESNGTCFRCGFTPRSWVVFIACHAALGFGPRGAALVCVSIFLIVRESSLDLSHNPSKHTIDRKYLWCISRCMGLQYYVQAYAPPAYRRPLVLARKVLFCAKKPQDKETDTKLYFC